MVAIKALEYGRGVRTGAQGVVQSGWMRCPALPTMYKRAGMNEASVSWRVAQLHVKESTFYLIYLPCEEGCVCVLDVLL